MPKLLLHTLYLLIILLFLPGKPINAQTNTAYTSGNTILATLEGITKPFVFTSDQLLVQYNQNTRKLECILNVATLLPVSDTAAPPAMAYEVLYGAKYPELYFEIDMSSDQVSSPNLDRESILLPAKIRLQGVANETVIPVIISPDKQSLLFSTNFDLWLDSFQAIIPVKYTPLLTGRLFITIRSARWANL